MEAVKVCLLNSAKRNLISNINRKFSVSSANNKVVFNISSFLMNTEMNIVKFSG